MEIQRPAAGGQHSDLAPMQIAHNPLFTTREKISLLQRLRAEVMGALENELDVGLSPAEIDEAIEEVKLGAQNGEGGEAVLRRDN